MALENHIISPFGPYSALKRPSSGQSGRKFDNWLNFQIKTKNKFNKS